MKSKTKKVKKLSRIKEDVDKVSIVADDMPERPKNAFFGRVWKTKPRVVEIERKKGVMPSFKSKKENVIDFGMRSNYDLKKEPEKCYVIIMLFANGTMKEFVLKTSEQTFSISNNPKKHYHLYYEECYYNLSLNQFCLIYHENYVEPINREITVDNTESPYFSVSPDNMKDFVDMKYLKVITEAEQGSIFDFLKRYWLPIVIGIVVIWSLLKQNGG